MKKLGICFQGHFSRVMLLVTSMWISRHQQWSWEGHTYILKLYHASSITDQKVAITCSFYSCCPFLQPSLKPYNIMEFLWYFHMRKEGIRTAISTTLNQLTVSRRKIKVHLGLETLTLDLLGQWINKQQAGCTAIMQKAKRMLNVTGQRRGMIPKRQRRDRNACRKMECRK